jgi:hypothetical protein
MNREKIIYFLKNYGGIPILICLVCGLIYNQYYIHKVNNCDYEIISCKVYKVGKVSKMPGYNIYFHYRIKGKEYDERDKVSNIYNYSFRYFLIGKNVPLLICKSNPKYHEILLLPEDFEGRDLIYPDSLKIYLEYLK